MDPAAEIPPPRRGGADVVVAAKAPGDFWWRGVKGCLLVPLDALAPPLPPPNVDEVERGTKGSYARPMAWPAAGRRVFVAEVVGEEG